MSQSVPQSSFETLFDSSTPQTPNSAHHIHFLILPGLRFVNQERSRAEKEQWVKALSLDQARISKVELFNYSLAKTSPLSSASVGEWSQRLLIGLDTKRKQQSAGPHVKLVICCQGVGGGIILDHALLSAVSSPLHSETLRMISGVLYICCPSYGDDVNLERHAKCLTESFSTELDLRKRASSLESTLTPDVKRILKNLKSRSKFTPTFDCHSTYVEQLTKIKSRHWIVLRKTKKSLIMGEAHVQRGPGSELRSLPGDYASIADFPLGQKNDLELQLSQICTSIVDKATSVPSEPQQDAVLPIRSTKIPTRKSAIPRHCHIIQQYEPNPRFTGRKKELEKIGFCLDPSSATGNRRELALYGIGGAGKTQTALEYVFSRRDIFPVILWAQADTRVKLNASFAEFAEGLGIVTSKTKVGYQAVREQVKAHLKSLECPWIMIFDNADGEKLHNSRAQMSEDSEDDSILDDYWPRGDHGSILVTARSRASLASFTGSFCEIGRLDEADSVELLLKIAGVAGTDEDRGRAKFVCDRLGCLALGIASAGELLVAESHSLADLTRVTNEELFENSGKIAELANFRVYRSSLRIVWKIHYDKLEALSKDAMRLLHILAFLDPDKIQEDLITAAAAKSTDTRLHWLRSEQAFRRERTNLSNSTLVMRLVHAKQMQMHRLPQSYVHIRMSPQDSQAAFDMACEILQCVWPFQNYEKRHDSSLWDAQEEGVDHIAHLAERYRLSTFDEKSTPLRSGPEFARLVISAAWYCYERGLFKTAEKLLENALRFCKKYPESSELNLADLYYTRASIDTESNQAIRALENFRKENEYLEKAKAAGLISSPSFREILSIGGLANGYMGANNPEEAEPHYKRCLAEAAKFPNAERGIYENHLATCLDFQGRYSEAEAVLVEVINARASHHGPLDTTSFRTGILYQTLGNNKARQALWDEAMEAQLASKEMLSATIGTDHHRYADTLYKIGWLHWRRGISGGTAGTNEGDITARQEYEDARETLEQAVGVYKQDEAYNIELSRTKFKLHQVFARLDMVSESQEALKDAERLRKKSMGEGWIAAQEEADYDSVVMFWSR